MSGSAQPMTTGLYVTDVYLLIGESKEHKRTQTESIDRSLVHDQQRVWNFPKSPGACGITRRARTRTAMQRTHKRMLLKPQLPVSKKAKTSRGKTGYLRTAGGSLKWAQSLHTELRNSRAIVTGMRLAIAFNAWRWTAIEDCDADEWKRAASSSWFMVCRPAAIAQWWLEGAQSQKRHSLKIDWRKQWETIAGDAKCAAHRRDTRELYELAWKLGAFNPTPVPGVKLKNGTLTNDDDEGLARWAEHFAALLGGKQVENVKDAADVGHGDMRMMQLSNILDVSPGAVTKIPHMPKLAVGSERSRARSGLRVETGLQSSWASS